MGNGLVLFPLFVIIAVALVGQFGLSDLAFETAVSLQLRDSDTVLYDVEGHGCVFQGNLSACGEAGRLVFWSDPTGLTEGYMAWRNSSMIPILDDYELYYDTGAVMLVRGDLTSTDEAGLFDINSSMGVLVLVAGMILLAGVVGFRLVSSGMSETSVSIIVRGTFFLAVWGIFGLLALDLLLLIPLGIGGLLFFCLTVMYALGTVGVVGGGGGD